MMHWLYQDQHYLLNCPLAWDLKKTQQALEHIKESGNGIIPEFYLSSTIKHSYKCALIQFLSEWRIS